MSTENITSPANQPDVAKRSAVELIKESSRALRGTIAETLASDADHFSDADMQLLKFHGSYQQEDRDARKTRRKDGVGKHYIFMVRCKIPGGRVTADQYLALDAIAGQHANGTLRITTRQGIQFHGVLKDHLKPTIAEINACLLSTLGACGDVNRNVMACPAPLDDGVHAQLQETAAVLAAHLAPRTRAYHEIWLNGKPLTGNSHHEADLEPLYGKVYLPRKFKLGLTLPEDNCIDIYAQCLGFLALVESDRIVGYNVLVGGGMGMTHGRPNTFPHLAQPVCSIPAAAVVPTAEAVVRLFRDHGNRADRKRARLKYLVHDWGIDRFRDVLSEYVGGTLQEPKPVAVRGVESHLGWHPQGQGKWFYGLSIENGRIKDEGDFRLRTCLRTIVQRLRPSIRFSPSQDILLCDLDGGALEEIQRLLAEHGVRRPDELSNVQKWSMACPAIPTCHLAITESERALPGIIDQLEVELQRLGLQHERITVRMTGCPNGCARPYQSDIGLVGRSGDKYTVFVGGRALGDRLNFPLRDLVPLKEIVPLLVPLLADFRDKRQGAEGFGDYCQRVGLDYLQGLLPPPAGKAGGHAPRPASDGAPPAGPGAADGALPAPPATQAITVEVAPPVVTPAPLTTSPVKRSETFLAGPPGEELPDYTYRYNSDGSVRETVVYFYGDDLRAAEARPAHALRREAVYLGKVDPTRLHSARKLSDIYHVGPPWHERKDYRIDYHPDGQVAQTIVFYYDGDRRASEVPSGAVLRRQVVFDGPVSL